MDIFFCAVFQQAFKVYPVPTVMIALVPENRYTFVLRNCRVLAILSTLQLDKMELCDKTKIYELQNEVCFKILFSSIR